ncbi:hypothetical protein V9T40_013068 [Parthenolecanium corni]|uniref:Uncharacterized protein n=1 Tax=Parthenolecanium corni TaxID=536013 RepID=A0AAN9Y4T6_9HEMI
MTSYPEVLFSRFVKIIGRSREGSEVCVSVCECGEVRVPVREVLSTQHEGSEVCVSVCECGEVREMVRQCA